jgi:outer membrane protein
MGRRKAVFIVVLAAALAVGGTAQGGEIKIAVIDVNRILNESDAGKAARTKMEARYDELRKKIEGVSEEARKMKEELDKQKILLGKERLKEREDALAAKVNELRTLTQDSEREMQARQGEFTRDVLKLIEGKIDTVVEEEKIDLLLDRSSGVVHSDPSLDITARVLERVNREKAGGK